RARPVWAGRSGRHAVVAHRGGEHLGAAHGLLCRPWHGGGESRAVSARRLRRRLVSGAMTALVAALSLVAVLALLLILGYLVAKGASSLDWSFFVKNPVPAGQSG